MTTQAETALAAADGSYNYYPNTMINLCAISYQQPGEIPAAVQQIGLEVVWGPVQALSDVGIPYALAFVAFRSDPSEYTVVIRGTVMDSAETWLTEDFDVRTTVPFNTFVPDAPDGALVSKGTADGLNDILGLKDPDTGALLADYLQTVGTSSSLYVTGHSLGGTLVPPMFAYLNYVLYGGGYTKNMALWSFAGLTPGNGDFNTYFNSLFNHEFPFRLYNTLDVAPMLWWNKDGAESIYLPTYAMDGVEKEIFSGLFELADGKGYAQPQYGGVALPGTLHTESGFLRWIDELASQHHSSNYQGLVAAAYPIESSP